jgi:Uma2 family endonuclease
MAPPSREHRVVQFNIASIFNNYFKQNKKRCISIFEDQLDIDSDGYVLPDIMVFCYENSKDIPLIVIEVLSPSTRERDLGVKMEKYARLGIKEYWIVTWETLSVDIYLLTDENNYKLYKSYAYFALNKLNAPKRRNSEPETETVKEFSPVSVPELNVRLEDVFYFVE